MLNSRTPLEKKYMAHLRRRARSLAKRITDYKLDGAALDVWELKALSWAMYRIENEYVPGSENDSK